MSSLNIRNAEVEIYEFSRGFSEVLENGCWISGGFGNAIDRSNYDGEIPAPIQQYINNNQNIFGIPTGFAPPKKEVALIARVIDARYCVLAVANYLGKDNKGRDGIIGYRYFWLDRNSEINQHLELDGVGTLLNWWLQNPFVFKMNPDSFTGDKLVCNEYLEYFSSHNVNSNDQQNYPIYPVILTLAELNRDNPLQLHTQAAEEAEKAGLPLAWAWNVRRLNFPEMYVAISCEDETAKQAIERELARKIVNKVNPLGTPVQKEISKRTDRERLTGDEKSIEMTLDEFVSDRSASNERRSLETANAIVKILWSNKDLDWQKFFVADNQHVKHLRKDEDPQTESVKYYALLPILIPENIIIWLSWLREKRNQKQTKISFKTQNLILESCTPIQREFIVQYIYDGISVLLNELVYGNQNAYNLCRWLFVTHKENIWSKSFNMYAAKILECLDSTPYNISELFDRQATQDFLIKLRNNFLSEKVTTNKHNFRNLGELFSQRVKTELNPIKVFLNQYDKKLLDVNLLAAVCYHCSEGKIPYTVFSKLKTEDKNKIDRILSVASQEEILDENHDASSPSRQNHPTRRHKTLKGKGLSKKQEIFYKRRRQQERFLLVILIFSVLIFLVLFFPKLSNHLFQSLPSFSRLSLKESIEKCENLDTNTTQSSENKEKLQRCQAELKKLLVREMDKLSVLQKNETRDAEKNHLRESQTYMDIRDLFINRSVALQLKTSGAEKYEELDQHILSIMNYLKQSLDDKKPDREIFQPLENCAKKNQSEEFKACVKNLPLYENKR
ncbi:hypothetical protein WA1_08530 [Scytonema hofmannii PCC 7110]|uniref:Uncharacterized protein n=1 Tax=Scytonema hofmannii PCC 7110 TaxID=128403 RepID=A0A139WRX6_9CYAN|nr:hypothetical protein [Scytonema hofmannii]KYC35194.1 hypothetical protein WA1_08530 [Scytonema hofmannii PCC 7110]